MLQSHNLSSETKHPTTAEGWSLLTQSQNQVLPAIRRDLCLSSILVYCYLLSFMVPQCWGFRSSLGNRTTQLFVVVTLHPPVPGACSGQGVNEVGWK